MRSLSLVFVQLFIIASSLAASPSFNKQKKARGTAGVDEVYLDELKTKESALERNETKSRKAMKENPRNPAMVDSFGHVSSNKKQNESTKQKEEDIDRRQKAREGEAQDAEYENKRIWK